MRYIPRKIIIRSFDGNVNERKIRAKLEKMYPGTNINIKIIKGKN